MSKKSTGNWRPYVQEEPQPVPARGKITIGMGPGGSYGKEADIVLPIDPNTLQIVEEEE
jgi:hypothetical protein